MRWRLLPAQGGMDALYIRFISLMASAAHSFEGLRLADAFDHGFFVNDPELGGYELVGVLFAMPVINSLSISSLCLVQLFGLRGGRISA